jgi:hypothetical protein
VIGCIGTVQDEKISFSPKRRSASVPAPRREFFASKFPNHMASARSWFELQPATPIELLLKFSGQQKSSSFRLVPQARTEMIACERFPSAAKRVTRHKHAPFTLANRV